MHSAWLLLAMLIPLAVPLGARAEAERAHRREVLLLVKVLSYDYTLAARCNGSLRIGVAYRADDRRSAAAGHAVFAAFGELADERFTVQRMPIRGQLLPVRAVTDALHAARRSGINALYFAPGLPTAVRAALLELARAQRWSTLTGEEDVVRQGAAVGVAPHDGSFEILINRGAATRVGSRFSAQIFKVARVVGGGS